MDDWILDSLPFLVGLLANIATIAVLASGLLLIQRRLIRKSLRKSRERAFKKAGPFPISNEAIKLRVNELVEYGPKSVREEVEWLTNSLGNHARADYPLPLLISRDTLASFAQAYGMDANDLGSRVVLSPNQVPIIERCMELSRSTARYLEELASAKPVDGSCLPAPTSHVVHVPHRGLTLRPHLLPDRAGNAFAYDLIVSYRSHLTAPLQGEDPWLDLGEFSGSTWLSIDDVERARIKNRLEKGHLFDGYLPRLIRWERQYDSHTGRSRLHIAIAACSYSAVMLDHYPGVRQSERLSKSLVRMAPPAKGIRTERDVTGRQVNLLTLSMVPITRDGYLVLVERSKRAGSHEGLLGPAISGNLELHARGGITVDSDPFGIPDPRRALAREAKEEMGVKIDPEDVVITGLIGFDSPTEVGTTILMATSKLPLTLDELADQSFHADIIEGQWELGSELVGLRLPRTNDERVAIETWLLNSSELTAHATATSLAALAVVGDVSELSDISIQPDAPEPNETLLRRMSLS